MTSTTVKSRHRVLLTGLLALALLALGCTREMRAPNLGQLYNRSAQHEYPDRNPVVVIPGLLGTKLQDATTGQVIWGAFGKGSAHPGKPDDIRLIALPLDGSEPRGVAGGVLERMQASLLGLPLRLRAYIHILRTLGVAGYRDEDLSRAIDYGADHFTCFQFGYDWRRGVAEGARHLHDFLTVRRAYVEREIGSRYGLEKDVRFDLIAHSLGGLVARYYLRYGPAPLPADGSLPPLTWEGARHVERVILIGPPNAGSLEALQQLIKGVRYAPFLPRYGAAIVGSFPTAYQLLPRARHGAFVDAADRSQTLAEILDPELWERLEWGLADADQDFILRALLPDINERAERRRIAVAYQRQQLLRARQLQAALDVPATPPAGTRFYLVAGDSVATDAQTAINLETGKVKVIARGPGDGRVLRSSALMDERPSGPWQPRLVSPIVWKDVLFLFNNHLGLTRDPGFTDNILYRLLEEPAPP